MPDPAVVNAGPAESEAKSAWTPVGYVVKPHGVRGELRLQMDTPWEDFVGKVADMRLTPRVGGVPTVMPVEVRPVHRGVLIKVDAIDSPETAAVWRGAQVEVRAEHIPPCEEGEFYLTELLGVQVQDASGNQLGVMRQVLDNGGQPLGVIAADDGVERMLPLVPQTIRAFERTVRCLHVRVPAGLWDA